MQLAISGEFRDLLTRQAGVLSRQQALSLGLTASVIDNQLRSGRWQPLQRGVYASFSGAPGTDAQLWAAVLRAGPDAALSHRTAAELYELARPAGGPIHLTVAAGAAPQSIRGALVHYSRGIATARHPMLLPPRTRVEQTVLDLTQNAVSFDEAFDWICRAVGRRVTTAGRLEAALYQRTRVRWRMDLLAALADVADGAHSLLERRYVRDVERAHGLPAARRQARIVTGGRTRYADNLYPAARLAVELDGRAAHPPEQRWADSRRDNSHAEIGILTVRYNWADITTRPCLVAGQLAKLLRLRGAAVAAHRCGPSCPLTPGPPAAT